MMPGVNQEIKRLNVYIEASVVESFCEYCQERGLTKSAAAERIIRDYLYKYFKEKEIESGNRLDIQCVNNARRKRGKH